MSYVDRTVCGVNRRGRRAICIEPGRDVAPEIAGKTRVLVHDSLLLGLQAVRLIRQSIHRGLGVCAQWVNRASIFLAAHHLPAGSSGGFVMTRRISRGVLLAALVGAVLALLLVSGATA